MRTFDSEEEIRMSGTVGETSKFTNNIGDMHIFAKFQTDLPFKLKHF